MAKRDLSGRKFGHLTVLYLASRENLGTVKNHHRHHWCCECVCGAVEFVAAQSLLRGYTSRCWQCFLRDPGDGGYEKHPMYRNFAEMHNRAGPAALGRYWDDYGARGIHVCKRWYSFRNFVSDMWPKPAGTTLDRHNNDRGYSLRNCRWATNREQADNKRTSKEKITYKGETLSIADWADRLGVTYQTLDGRLKRGWSVKRTFTIPQEVKSGTRMFEHAGQIYTLKDVARLTGIPYRTVYRKLVTESKPIENLLNLNQHG
jgi:hypothetical protein